MREDRPDLLAGLSRRLAGARLEEDAHDLAAPRIERAAERGAAVLGLGLDVGARLDERRHGGVARVVLHGQVERRAPRQVACKGGVVGLLGWVQTLTQKICFTNVVLGLSVIPWKIIEPPEKPATPSSNLRSCRRPPPAAWPPCGRPSGPRSTPGAGTCAPGRPRCSRPPGVHAGLGVEG